MNENEIAKVIVDSVVEVHRVLGGPGLLESVYEEALVFELIQRGLDAQRQVIVPIVYKGNALTNPLRVDLIVNNKVIVECKAVTAYNTLFESQVLTYLRLTGLKLGLVVNFGETFVFQGVHRVVNGL